jgi:hypothetical protein
MASSVALYWAGMALNDYADATVDAVERPQRPCPPDAWPAAPRRPPHAGSPPRAVRKSGLAREYGVALGFEPEPLPVLGCVGLTAPRLVDVQIEDMKRGVHEHLEFGAGEIGFPPVLVVLKAAEPF